MRRENIYSVIFILSAVLVLASCREATPAIDQYFPEFGPPETLVTVKGENFNGISVLNFSDDVPADFNPSYGSENAILFRVPEAAPLGDNIITIVTEGGTLELPFRVTLEAPSLISFYPDAAPVGSEITFIGENFFEPLEILFFDSIAADIKYISEDSLVVIVPENSEKGFIKIKANGGEVITNKQFSPTVDHLISDFDGDGLHNDISSWLFYGFINENAFTALHESDPDPIDGKFLKLSGQDGNAIWLGGTEHPSNNIPGFTVYDITSNINNTFLEFDYNNNGNEESVVTIILREKDGSFNDFTTNLLVTGSGWQNKSLPLNRFKDLDGLTIDPQKIKVVKFHLVNPDNSNKPLEINIDNLKFVETK